ncbi:MAG: Wzy polymerase domain-containing protein [Burkholderiaceae bacterium]
MLNNFFFLLAFGTLLLGWLIPNHSLPWASWHSEAAAFLAAFIFAWSGLIRVVRAPGARAVTLPPAVLPFAGIALIALFQKVAALIPFWGGAIVFCLYVALCIVCLVMGFSMGSRQRTSGFFDAFSSLRVLASILLVAGAVSTIISFAQIFGLWESSEWILRTFHLRRPGANLAQPNHLATLLVMGVASVAFLYQSKRFGAVAGGLLLFVLFVGLATTESRTGMLSLLVLLGWWLLKRRQLGNSPPVWAGIGCVGIGLALFLAWPYLLNTLLLEDQARLNTTSSMRIEVWRQLLEAVAMKPWLGWGIHATAQAHNAVADRYVVSAPFSYSHNLLLDSVLWWGVPLTIVLVLVTGIWLWRRVHATGDLLPWYGLAVVLPLAVHSMLEYPFAYAYFLVPAMFAIGVTEASLGSRPLLRISAKPVAAVLAVLTAVLAWSVVEYLEVEEDFRVARFEALRIGTPPPEHQRPAVHLFDQLGLLLDDARITPTPHMSPADLWIVKEAALYYPWSATQYRYALALALNGEQQEAARQIQVMRRHWGEKAYAEIKEQIRFTAERYPELRELQLP